MFILIVYSVVRFLLTVQGQCKPNAESLFFAEVEPVLAISKRKGMAILANQQEFSRLLSEVVATGPAICDKRATSQKNLSQILLPPIHRGQVAAFNS